MIFQTFMTEINVVNEPCFENYLLTGGNHGKIFRGQDFAGKGPKQLHMWSPHTKTCLVIRRQHISYKCCPILRLITQS